MFLNAAARAAWPGEHLMPLCGFRAAVRICMRLRAIAYHYAACNCISSQESTTGQPCLNRMRTNRSWQMLIALEGSLSSNRKDVALEIAPYDEF